MTLRYRLRLLLLRTLGIAAGYLFQMWFTAFSFRCGAANPSNVGNVKPGFRLLVMRPDHLGDVLMTTPALRLLRDCLPEADITYLAGPWAAPALQGNPDVNRLIHCPFPGFARRPSTSSRRWQDVLAPYILVVQYAALLRRTGPYDAALVLRDDHWWGALLAYLSGIPCRVGVRRPEAAPFLTHALSAEQLSATTAHRAEQNLALAYHLIGAVSAHDTGREPLSIVVERYRSLGLRAVISAADEQTAAALLARYAVTPSHRVVALQAGAGATLKRWSPQAFAQVAAALSSDGNTTILLVGTMAERDLAVQIAYLAAQAQPLTRSVVLAGETTWGVLGAVLKRCHLVIGVDSGTLHLAVALGRPSVALFGPVDLAAFGPWGDPHQATAALHAVVAADLPCRPCRRLDYCALQPRGGPLPVPCLAAISPTEVVAAARLMEAGHDTGPDG